MARGLATADGFGRVLQQWSVTTAARVGGILLRLVFAVLVSRFYGAPGLALYVLALPLITGPSVLASLGLEATVARLTAHHLGRDEPARARGVLVRCCRVAAATGMALGLVMFAGANQLATWLRDPGVGDAARLAAVVVALGAVGAVARAGLTGMGGARSAAVLDQVAPAVVALPALIAMHAAGWASPVAGAAAMAAGLTVTAVASLLTLGIRAASLPAPATFEPLPWRRFSLPMWLEQGLAYVMGAAGYFLIARGRGTGDVAQFGAAMRLAVLVILPLEAAAAILGPLFATLAAREAWPELQRLYSRATWALLAAGMGVGAVTLVGGRWALAGFGAGLEAGYGTLALLVVGQVVTMGTGPCGLLTVMTGHAGARVANVAVGAFLAVVLSALAVPRWGAPGAAGALAVATIVLNVRQVRQVKRLVGLRTYDVRVLREGAASGANR